jgi:hypothetical protein
MAELVKCVVCGAGSHREDWQSKANPACDSHTKAEVAVAIAAKNPPPAPVSPPVATPPIPTK